MRLVFAFRSDFGHDLSADGFGVGEVAAISVKTHAGGRVSHFADKHSRAGNGVSSPLCAFAPSRLPRQSIAGMRSP